MQGGFYGNLRAVLDPGFTSIPSEPELIEEIEREKEIMQRHKKNKSRKSAPSLTKPK
ncbi:MAG: hypothetical protein Q7V05_12420 [Methanoregula sp.]|nr:hypothetical protein [Methanoregula sp.]